MGISDSNLQKKGCIIWLTFTRLRYNTGRDFLFDTAGGASGKYWYKKAVANSHQIKYGGNNGLEALIQANNNRPVYNIVVSFSRNGSSSEHGHVMLIDAIINGKVYCSDNRSPGVLKIYNSIAEFKKAYSNSNGVILGVVHVK